VLVSEILHFMTMHGLSSIKYVTTNLLWYRQTDVKL
jgi:hypothetical protein